MDKSKSKLPILAVACAEDKETLSAVVKAKNQNIIKPILVGEKSQIENILTDLGEEVSDYEVVDESEKSLAAKKAVLLVSSKKADFVMKGLVDTKVILKEVLNQDHNLRTDNLLSHIAMFEFDGRKILLTDAAMNIKPTKEQLKQIIENAVFSAQKLGIAKPKVALLSAVEKVSPKMESSVIADEIAREHQEGFLPDCQICGPLALDNAMSIKSAKKKGITNPVAGNADILVVPSIEAGNVLYKSLTIFGDITISGAIVGAKVPIVLTSRADSQESKLNSIKLSADLTKEC